MSRMETDDYAREFHDFELHPEPAQQDESPYSCPECKSSNVDISDDKERAHCYECLHTAEPEDFGWTFESRLELVRRRPPVIDLGAMLFQTTTLLNRAAADALRKPVLSEVPEKEVA